MIKRSFYAFALLLILSQSLFAGARGVRLAFLDATSGQRSKASLRLGELLEKDMRSLYLDPQLATAFPWSHQELALKVLDSKTSGISFDPLLNTKDGAAIASLFEELHSPDGLIVFYHDAQGGYARLKLYSWDGTEVMLLRLPLEKEGSAMPDSLMKGHRRGALMALGAAVRWSP